MAKLYPIHKLSQPLGQLGIFMSWLWTAKTLAVVSHTTHLKINEASEICILKIQSNLDMYS